VRYDPREDGITHINIYSKAQTPLGRALSNWTPCTIETSIGQFRSIEGLIFFLGSFDDRLREVVGFEAKQLGEELDRGIRLPEDVFKKIVKEGMASKINHLTPEFRKQFKYSKLPFTHYYTYGNKVINIPKWQWQVEEWENLRQRLQT
jgi:hypothetical protein